MSNLQLTVRKGGGVTDYNDKKGVLTQHLKSLIIHKLRPKASAH